MYLMTLRPVSYTHLPFWEKRSIRHKILENMSEEWKDAYAAGIFTEFMEQREMCIRDSGYSQQHHDTAEHLKGQKPYKSSCLLLRCV